MMYGSRKRSMHDCEGELYEYDFEGETAAADDD